MTTKDKKGTDLLYALIAQASQYSDTIVMGRGDPDFDTPAHIVAAAAQAMTENGGEYSPPEGILPLREAIAARVKKYNNFDVDPATEVVVTNGGQEALFLMVLAAVGPGEEMLTPDPNYNTYNDALRFVGATHIPVTTTAESSFRVDPAAMEAALTPQTKAMLLVSPNNPAASVIAPDDVHALVKLAEERDLLILSDEIYDRFIYDDFKHLSPASVPGGKARTLTLNALSKSFSMTGWRMGWVVGPADLMAQVKALKAAISGPNSIVSQYAGLAALTGPQEPMEQMLAEYTKRRRMVLDALDAMDIPYGVPQGGQFVFADISFTGMSSLDLAQKILEEEHVLAYPGAAFGPSWENCIRITFLQPEDKLRDGLERMERAMFSIMSKR